MATRQGGWKPRYPRKFEAELESWASDCFLPGSTQKVIRNLLFEAEEGISILTTEIWATKSYLKILMKQRRRDMKRISTLRARIAPIKRPPAEVMGELFLFCLPRVVLPPHKDVTHTCTLSQVCSRWR